MTSESNDAYMCTEDGDFVFSKPSGNNVDEEKKKMKEVNSNMMLELKYEEVA